MLLLNDYIGYKRHCWLQVYEFIKHKYETVKSRIIKKLFYIESTRQVVINRKKNFWMNKRL